MRVLLNSELVLLSRLGSLSISFSVEFFEMTNLLIPYVIIHEYNGIYVSLDLDNYHPLVYPNMVFVTIGVVCGWAIYPWTELIGGWYIYMGGCCRYVLRVLGVH